ncbi:UDP-3-O-(3-hydroxymyristoyl)glucosamine N-acyltransferase [Oscillatoria sp. FACHB-1407]|uniref:UDP-3-O-(3-hydroxymyristoyl)glucosamine N-acyltransferase n=1 Tax=Oscillatoria sp. FACHB-1407 TaxID=2692847 RepID=UPI001689422F|nr:UDP-3-O-(3-hydroxymyristoyl)glucosamine N-acyltransferase [Oscillatoria sp. FACHB-1407]MBD2463852.1 UDP-3-O-(3-hydroxymyristoyl)glucosamine N-acyltransferase [Oscillatoria sp. FACHB-1407]
MKFSELVTTLEATTEGLNHSAAQNPEITGVAAIDEAPSGTLSYVEGEKYAGYISQTGASALILPPNAAWHQQASDRNIAWISTSNPRLLFAKAIALFYQPFRPQPEIHPTAVIHPSAKVGQRVAIGAHVVIQPGVTIGDDVCIHPNVVIYPDVQIGDRTVLHANCVIHERSLIGADCVIHSGAAIGAEGFGFVPIPEGWQKIEQSGYVVLEDGVEVGCHSAVDRPAVGETRVRRNTKLDNMVHVAHGCQIGENCALAAQVGLAGGVVVGNRVILGGQVGVSNQARIGDGAQAGAKAGIHSSVQPGEIVMGIPAVPYKLFLKGSAIYNRLPEMYQSLRQIQKRLGGEKKEKEERINDEG